MRMHWERCSINLIGKHRSAGVASFCCQHAYRTAGRLRVEEGDSDCRQHAFHAALWWSGLW